MEMRHIVAILQRAYRTEFSGTGKEGQDGRRRKKIKSKNDRNTICTIPVPQFKLQLQNGKSLPLTKVQSRGPVTYHKYNTVCYRMNTSIVQVIPTV